MEAILIFPMIASAYSVILGLYSMYRFFEKKRKGNGAVATVTLVYASPSNFRKVEVTWQDCKIHENRVETLWVYAKPYEIEIGQLFDIWYDESGVILANNKRFIMWFLIAGAGFAVITIAGLILVDVFLH